MFQFNYDWLTDQCDLLSQVGENQNVLSVTGPKVCANYDGKLLKKERKNERNNQVGN